MTQEEIIEYAKEAASSSLDAYDLMKARRLAFNAAVTSAEDALDEKYSEAGIEKLGSEITGEAWEIVGELIKASE
jgi:hypothetical protein